MLETNRNKKISMFRGDTLSFGVGIDGVAVQDLSGAYFTCRKTPTSDIIFQKSIGDGITKVDPGEHVLSYKVRVAPEDTEDVNVGTYVYDLEIEIGDDVFTILCGPLEILHDITY